MLGIQDSEEDGGAVEKGRFRIAVIAGLVVATMLAGCAKGLSTDEVETRTRDILQRDLSGGNPRSSVNLLVKDVELLKVTDYLYEGKAIVGDDQNTQNINVNIKVSVEDKRIKVQVVE